MLKYARLVPLDPRALIGSGMPAAWIRAPLTRRQAIRLHQTGVLASTLENIPSSKY